MGLAFISDGRLYLKPENGAETEVFSDFVRDLKKRLKSVEDRRRALGTADERAFFGMPMHEPAGVDEFFQAEFSCVGRSPNGGDLCYAVDASDVRGLFSYSIADNYERRLYHGPDFRFTSISTREAGEGSLWLVAAARNHGSSRIGLFEPDAGGGIRDVTEGESVDAFPVWIPGEANAFAYQTSGIARNTSTGAFMGLGPASIQSVSLETGEMNALMENEKYDYLCPAYSPDGTLYFLRRPYEPFHKQSITDVAKDVLLFPFRLCGAIFAFLNSFSLMFSGKPLRTAGGKSKNDGPDPKALFLYGRWVSMKRELEQEGELDADASVVPKNWELRKREVNGAESVVVNGVMSYTVGGQGTLYYSNGKGIYRLKPEEGIPEKLSSRRMVTAISTC